MAMMKDKLQYMFIRPSWRGAWCWDQVLSVMRAWGREAYAADGPGHGTIFPDAASVFLIEERIFEICRHQAVSTQISSLQPGVPIGGPAILRGNRGQN
jgi:hypothetical protein